MMEFDFDELDRAVQGLMTNSASDNTDKASISSTENTSSSPAENRVDTHTRTEKEKPQTVNSSGRGSFVSRIKDRGEIPRISRNDDTTKEYETKKEKVPTKTPEYSFESRINDKNKAKPSQINDNEKYESSKNNVNNTSDVKFKPNNFVQKRGRFMDIVRTNQSKSAIVAGPHGVKLKSVNNSVDKNTTDTISDSKMYNKFKQTSDLADSNNHRKENANKTDEYHDNVNPKTELLSRQANNELWQFDNEAKDDSKVDKLNSTKQFDELEKNDTKKRDLSDKISKELSSIDSAEDVLDSSLRDLELETASPFIPDAKVDKRPLGLNADMKLALEAPEEALIEETADGRLDEQHPNSSRYNQPSDEDILMKDLEDKITPTKTVSMSDYFSNEENNLNTTDDSLMNNKPINHHYVNHNSGVSGSIYDIDAYHTPIPSNVPKKKIPGAVFVVLWVVLVAIISVAVGAGIFYIQNH